MKVSVICIVYVIIMSFHVIINAIDFVSKKGFSLIMNHLAKEGEDKWLTLKEMT